MERPGQTRPLPAGLAAVLALAMLGAGSGCSQEQGRENGGVSGRVEDTQQPAGVVSGKGEVVETARTSGGAAGEPRSPAPRKQVLGPVESAPPFLSPAVRSGNLIFLSGQLGRRPGETGLVPGGAAAEANQVLENIRSLLTDQGLAMQDIVKCTVFLADMADYAAVNEVYRRFFPSEPPARSAVAVSGMALDARVEIECIAAAHS